MKKGRTLQRIVITVCLLFLALGYVGSAAAQANTDLSKPLLLVATPELLGLYSHAVLIAVPMEGDRHIGFIVNRATKMTMAKLFPDHAPSAKVVDPVYFGGPEASETLFALLRRDPGKPSKRLSQDLFVVANGKAIDKVIETTPNEARYLAGFVGWKPGELAYEFKSGAWYAFDADADAVFRKSADSLWEEYVQKAYMREKGI